MKPRRREATEKIESKAARNVCFSKRRQGLFKKAAELRRLIPNVSVTAIAFSPAGTPFFSGDPSSVFNLVPPTKHQKTEMVALLGLNIASLNMAELESHKKDLIRLRSFLLSKCMDRSDDPHRQGKVVSGLTTEIEEEDGSRGPLPMSTDCGDDLNRNEGSGFALVESIRIEDDDDEEIEVMLRDFLNDGDANCNMEYGLSHNIGSEFVPVCNDGIEEDDEIGVMLRDFLNDGVANCDVDLDASW